MLRLNVKTGLPMRLGTRDRDVSSHVGHPDHDVFDFSTLFREWFGTYVHC